MFGRRLTRAAVLAVAGTLVMASIVMADTITIENTVGLNDNVSKSPGNTGTVLLRLDTTNGTPVGDVNGCNAQSGTNSQGSPLIVTLASSNSDVTLDASGTVTFTACTPDAGGYASLGYTVGANACGSATISATGVSGGKNGADRLYETSDTMVITLPACGPSYTFGGFYRPVDMDQLNIAKAGQAIPLKFNVWQGSTEITDPASIQWKVQKVDCDSTNGGDPIEQYVSGSTSLRYDAVSGQFVFNWKSEKSWAGFCYRAEIGPSSTAYISADFSFTR
jgi:hypothetical protein